MSAKSATAVRADTKARIIDAAEEVVLRDGVARLTLEAAAAEAGVHAVGVATGSFSAADLRAEGAEVVLDSLREFPPWYAALRTASG